ncbi:MAG: DNA polymerase III subunit [Planctomycetota bacterium]|nr:DNA polymerase III subunit [Planctomycetota bacterium]
MSWDEILGQEKPISTLRKGLDGRMPHALLLFGPRGVGKGLGARILAQALLCREGAPCGKCLSCGKVLRETHGDLLRLAPAEGKRWITVAQVREGIDWMRKRPIESERRCLWIDPADSLRTEAAAALLKTLEEPPEHGVLILQAESPASLPDTVVSRCRPVRFLPLGDDHLREILSREGIDPSRIESAVKLGAGSAGRAIAFAREGGEDLYRFLIDLLGEIDSTEPPAAAQAVVDRFDGDRQQIAEALEMIGQVCRDRLVAGVGAEDLALLPDRSASPTPASEILRIFPILWRSRDDVASFVDPGLVLQRAFWEIRTR